MTPEEKIKALEERVCELESELRSLKIKNGYIRLPPPAG